MQNSWHLLDFEFWASSFIMCPDWAILTTSWQQIVSKEYPKYFGAFCVYFKCYHYWVKSVWLLLGQILGEMRQLLFHHLVTHRWSIGRPITRTTRSSKTRTSGAPIRIFLRNGIGTFSRLKRLRCSKSSSPQTTLMSRASLRWDARLWPTWWGKSAEEIRRTFNIENDLTAEEEEQIRKENAWCEERWQDFDDVTSLRYLKLIHFDSTSWPWSTQVVGDEGCIGPSKKLLC